MKKTGLAVLAAFVLTAVAAAMPSPSRAADVPRISPEVTEALLGNPEVVVIDVRRGSDYESSGAKIKGAVRESEKDVSWSGKYGKEKLLILYCA